ncbi:MAG: hypothetical protein ACK532_21030, partial [Acidobacteriota bacterium]
MIRATKSEVPPAPFVFTVISTPPPEKPGPRNVKRVVFAVACEFAFVVFARICDSEVVADPEPMSVPAAPRACTPFKPKLWESTVEVLRSTETDPFAVDVIPFEVLPPPINTDSERAKLPPVFRP